MKARKITVCLAGFLCSLVLDMGVQADDDTLRDLGPTAAPGEIPKWDGAQWRNAHDNGIVSVTAGPGLTGGGTNVPTLGVTFGGSATNTLVARYAEMDATRPPVGAIVAWAKNLTGVSTNLPAGWVECNGQTLNETNSPLYGTTIPPLNGATSQRFLRGAASSGGTGGSESHNHYLSISYGHYDAGGHGFLDNVLATNNIPPYYEVVWIMRVK